MAYTEAIKMPGGSASDLLNPAGRESRSNWRRRLLFGLAFCATGVAATFGARWYLESAHVVTTDDAYVDASLAEITPQIDGTVKEVRVFDTQHVRRGQLLVRLDPADTSLAVEQARAAKQSNLKRAQLDLHRRFGASETGAISAEEISNASNALDDAKSELSIAQQQLVAQRTLTQDVDIAHNPEVLAAKAALDKAQLDLERTEIRAPIDGVVAERQAQIGQRVKVGSTLMTVVPLMDAHVDANFKEVQLQRIRSGQSVTLTSDIYGTAVVFHGRVAGVGGGTGAAFAVIPAQNATGNWIKIVQRLPVRITLEPSELARNPLQVGLSMTAQVNTDDTAEAPKRPTLRMAASRTAF